MAYSHKQIVHATDGNVLDVAGKARFTEGGMIGDSKSKPDSDAKEVGMGNPAEETYAARLLPTG